MSSESLNILNVESTIITTEPELQRRIVDEFAGHAENLEWNDFAY